MISAGHGPKKTKKHLGKISQKKRVFFGSFPYVMMVVWKIDIGRKTHPFVKRKKEPTPLSTRARSCSTDWGALLPASFPGSNLRQIVEKTKIKQNLTSTGVAGRSRLESRSRQGKSPSNADCAADPLILTLGLHLNWRKQTTIIFSILGLDGYSPNSKCTFWPFLANF